MADYKTKLIVLSLILRTMSMWYGSLVLKKEFLKVFSGLLRSLGHLGALLGWETGIPASNR